MIEPAKFLTYNGTHTLDASVADFKSSMNDNAKSKAVEEKEHGTRSLPAGKYALLSRTFIQLACFFFVLVFSITSLTQSRIVLGQNDASRWDTVWSLTSGRGYAIDDAPYPTVDKVYREGHFYSSKPALLPTITACVTLAISRLAGLSFDGNGYWLVRLVLVFINVVPFVLFLSYFAKWLSKQPYAEFTKVYCLLSAAFGTYLTAYSVTLNNHTVAAIGLFFTLYALHGVLSGSAKSRITYFWCGLGAAWVVANELISWPFWLYVIFILYKRDRRETLLLFLPGTLVIAACFLICTCLAAGDCVPFYLKHQLYQYPGSYWKHPAGIDAIRENKIIYSFNYLIGHHGIVSLTPIFTMAFAGMMSPQTIRPIRLGALSLTAINAIFVIFGTHNYGGACQGARWFMWLIPLWLFCLPPVVERLAHFPFGRVYLALAMSVSVASVLYALLAYSAGPWSTSWIHDWERYLGLINY